MSFGNAGFSVKVGAGRLIQRGTSDDTNTAAYQLIVSGGTFVTTAQVGDRIVNTTDSSFATVVEVIDNDKLKLDKDIFQAVSKGFDHIRASFEPMHPGLGAEAAISTLLARTVSAEGGNASLYTIDLVRFDPTTGLETLVARSDKNGVLANVLELAKSDGGTGDTSHVAMALLPNYFNAYRVKNFRLEAVHLVAEGLDKSLTQQ